MEDGCADVDVEAEPVDGCNHRSILEVTLDSHGLTVMVLLTLTADDVSPPTLMQPLDEVSMGLWDDDFSLSISEKNIRARARASTVNLLRSQPDRKNRIYELYLA